ncbi:MAG: ABC transporter ATP-binding protein [Peptococcaceae bacterium]|nr:ABC transporter ATP-binding protein [Peptococcaceae bacterium]
MIVDMHEVSLIRDGLYLLANINWQINPGENWVVFGLNGSGKTTLLKLVTSYIRPSKGEMSVLGKQIGRYDVRELRKLIGWVSSSLQEQLHAYDTILDIVLSGKFATIGLYDVPSQEDKNKALAILQQLGCESMLGRTYDTLSQGEKQKILIGRALMNSPQLLILDEPCTGLDVLAREQILKVIDKLSKAENAPTLLYVTHHVEEILPEFNRTLLLQKGKIHSMGVTREVIASENMSDFLQTPVSITWQVSRPAICFEVQD